MKKLTWKLIAVILAIIALIAVIVVSVSNAGKSAEQKSEAKEETAEAAEAAAKEEAEETEEAEEEEVELAELDPDRETLDMENLDTEIRICVENMRTGSFADVVKFFSEDLKVNLDEKALREAWDGVVKDLGKFKKHGEVTINEAEDGTLEVSLISEYEKTNLRTQLNINENGEIIAVWFFFVDPSDTEGPALSDAELKEAGKKYFNLMRTGDFGGITTYFTSGLKNGLSAGALRGDWANLTANLGAFKSITSVDLVKNGNTVEVSVHASFQESGLKTTFVLYPNGKIDGIWFYYEEDESAKLSVAQLEAKMKAHFEMMRSGNFDGVFSDFTMGFKNMLSAAQLRDVWNQQVAPLGAYKNVASVSTIQNDAGLYEVSLVSHWEGDGLKITFIYTASGKVDGIWFYYEALDSGVELSVAQLEALLRKHFDMMLAGNYSGIYNDFTTGLKSMLSANQLKTAWTDFITPLGAHTKTLGTSTIKNDAGLYEVSIQSYWENDALKVTYIYTPAGKVDGIWFFYEALPGEEEKPADFTAEEAIALLETHVENMRTGRSDLVVADLTRALKGNLSANALQDAWNGMAQPLGEFVKHGEATVSINPDTGNFEAVMVSEFKVNGLQTMFIITPTGEIDGIWFDHVQLDTDAVAEYAEMVKTAVDNMRNGNFDAVVATFSPELKQNLSAQALADAWASVTNGLGAWVEHASDTAVRTSETNIEATDLSHFENLGLRTVLSIDNSKQVTAVWFYHFDLPGTEPDEPDVPDVPDEPDVPAEPITAEEALALTEKHVENMRNDRCDLVAADFSAGLANNLSAVALRNAWHSMVDPLGEFVKHQDGTVFLNESTGNFEVNVISEFAINGNQTTFVILPTGEIDAIWFNIVQLDPAAVADYAEKVKTAVDNMRNGNFEAVEAEFSDALLQGLNAESLAAAWADVTSGLGNYVRHESDTALRLSATAVEATDVSRFENRGLRTVFSYDADDKITAIWFFFVDLPADGGEPEPEPEVMTDEKLVALTDEVMALMAAGEFSKLNTQYFTAELATNLSASALENAWNSMVRATSSGIDANYADYGNLVSGTTTASVSNYVGVCKQNYEHGFLRTELQFTEAGKLDGIWFYRSNLTDNDFAAKVASYVTMMGEGNFAGVGADFTPALNSVFNADALKGAWDSWNLGALTEHESTAVYLITNGGANVANSDYSYAYRVTTVDMYENGGMRLMFTMTPDGKVCNLNNWAVARAVTPQGLVDEMIQIINEKNFAELNTRLGNGFDFGAYFSNYIFQTGDGVAENDRTISGFTRTWVSQQPWWTVMELDLQMSDGAKYLLTFEYNANNYNLNGFWCSRIASADELIAEAASFIRYAQDNEYDWWTQRFVGSYDLQTDLNNNFFSYVDENGVTQTRTIVSYDGGTLTEFSDCLRADVTFTFSDGKVFTFHFPYDFNGINLLNLWYDDVTPAPAAVAAEEEEVPAEEPAEEPVEEPAEEPVEEPIETPEPAEQEEAALPEENELPDAAPAPEKDEPETPEAEEPTEA